MGFFSFIKKKESGVAQKADVPALEGLPLERHFPGNRSDGPPATGEVLPSDW